MDTNQIDEDTAFQVLSMREGGLIADPSQRSRADLFLGDYRRQQERAGEVMFPRRAIARGRELERVRTLAKDREKHGLNDHDLADLRETFKGDEEGKFAFLNNQFLAHQYDTPFESVAKAGLQYRNEYSRLTWGEASPTNKAFSERLALDIEAEEGAHEWAQESARQGLSESLVGRAPDKLLNNPAYKHREKEFQESMAKTFALTAAQIAPYQQGIQLLVEEMQIRTGVKDGDGDKPSFSDAFEFLRSVPESDLDAVLSTVITRGKTSGDDKWFIQKLGENIGRGGRDLGLNIATANDRDALQEVRYRIAAGAEPKEGQTVDDFVQAETADVMQGSAIGGGYLTALLSPAIDMEKLSDVQRQAMAIIDEEFRSFEIAKRLRHIADEEIDPARSNYKLLQGVYDASRSIPYMGAAAVPFIGWGVTGFSMAEDANDQLRLMNPDMTEDQIFGLSLPAGLLMGAIEKIPFKVLQGKLPFASRYLNGITRTSGQVAGRMAVRTGAAMGVEMVQENVQDFTPFAVQGLVSAMAKDMPDIPIEAVLGRMAENQERLFYAVLPLALIGGGVGTWRDYKKGPDLLQSADALSVLLEDKAIANEITTMARAGDLDGAAEKFTLAFRATKKATPGMLLSAEQLQEKANTLSRERREAFAEAQVIGVLPAFKVNENGDGYTLTFDDGRTSQYTTSKEAIDSLWNAANDNEIMIHEAVRGVISQVMSQMEAGREVKYIFDAGTNDLAQAVEAGKISEEAANNRADIAERDNFDLEWRQAVNTAKLSGKERLASLQILGENSTTFQDGVTRTVVRLYQGANPLTVIEEKAEGDISAILNRPGGRDLIVNAIREYERNSGDLVFAPDKADSELATNDIKEGYSSLVTAYFVSGKKKGDGSFGVEKKLKDGSSGIEFRRLAARIMKGQMGDAMIAYGHFFRAVWRRAARINKLKRNGALPAVLEQELARSTGMMTQSAFESSSLSESAAILAESGRFVFEKPVADLDAPYSVLADPDARIAAMFSPFLRDPKLREKLVAKMTLRGQELARDFAGIIAANKSGVQIERESKDFEAEALDRQMLSLSDTEKALLKNGAATVDAPILEGLRKDKMKARSAAIKDGMSGDAYTNMPTGLPSYIWGGQRGPDQWAEQYGFDSVTDFWSALKEEQVNAANAKAAYGEVLKKVAGIRKQAKIEGTAYADYLKQQRATVGSDRATLLGALRTLQAIQNVLPPEVRGKIGGHIALAELKTPGKMIEEIDRRVQKINEKLEMYLSEKADKSFARFRKKVLAAKSDRTGEAPKSKRGTPEMHRLMKAVFRAKEMTAADIAVEVNNMSDALARGTVDADKINETQLMVTLLPLFAGWDSRVEYRDSNGNVVPKNWTDPTGSKRRVVLSNSASASQKTQALREAKKIWADGMAAWAAKEAWDQSQYDAANERIIADIKKTSRVLTEDQQANRGLTPGGIAAMMANTVRSFPSLIKFYLGDTADARAMIDARRKAADSYHAGIQRISVGVEALFVAMAGGQRKGRRLRSDMSLATIHINDSIGNPRILSQLQGIQAMLMWRQPDGKRHMEGLKDDSGKVVGDWSFDQSFMNELATHMSREAIEVFNYLVHAYAIEYDSINKVYRKVYGIDLPQNRFYSPLTLLNHAAISQTDPLAGFLNSGGMQGAFKTRGSAIVEPRFDDAVRTFLSHSMVMEHFKTHAQVSKDLSRTLGSEKVMTILRRAGGTELVQSIEEHLKIVADGAIRVARVENAVTRFMHDVGSRTAKVILFGKAFTIFINAVQVSAAAVHMSPRKYIEQVAKLVTGQLNFREAWESEFIRQRVEQMPVLVRRARSRETPATTALFKALDKFDDLVGLEMISEWMGDGINQSDGFFTAMTYAMVLDDQMAKAGRPITEGGSGLSGADLRAYAINETERLVTETAQPTNDSNRSLMEVGSSPWFKVLFPFGSEARKNMNVMLDGFSNRTNPEKATGTFIFTILASTVAVTLLRAAWRDLRDPDDREWFDEKHWSWESLTVGFLTDWMYGLPILGDMARDGLMSLLGQRTFKGSTVDIPQDGAKALHRLFVSQPYNSGDYDRVLNDVQKSIAGLGYLNRNAANAAAIANVIADAAKVVKNLSK